jgi:hypothetical protein
VRKNAHPIHSLCFRHPTLHPSAFASLPHPTEIVTSRPDRCAVGLCRRQSCCSFGVSLCLGGAEQGVTARIAAITSTRYRARIAGSLCSGNETIALLDCAQRRERSTLRESAATEAAPHDGRIRAPLSGCRNRGNVVEMSIGVRSGFVWVAAVVAAGCSGRVTSDSGVPGAAATAGNGGSGGAGADAPVDSG